MYKKLFFISANLILLADMIKSDISSDKKGKKVKNIKKIHYKF